MGALYVFLKDVGMTYVATKIAWQALATIIVAVIHHLH
jgi:hypothetical protein